MESLTPLPSFPVRVGQLLVAPGRLFDALKERPVWKVALLVGAVVAAGSLLLVPGDIWGEMARAQILATGQEMPAEIGNMGNIYRIGGAVGSLVVWPLAALFVAGVLTGVFAFMLGDRVSYWQMLSAYAHTSLVGALGALLMAPLRVAQRDPQLTLSLGTFLPGLDGYAAAFLGGLELFGLWSSVLLGVAVSRFDPRRPVGTAVGITVGTVVLVTAAVAVFTS